MKKYAIRQELAFRSLEDQMIIVDPVDNELHTLSGVGSFIWEKLASGMETEAALLTAITATFEVEPERAAQDLRHFLVELADKRLFEVSLNNPPPNETR